MPSSQVRIEEIDDGGKSGDGKKGASSGSSKSSSARAKSDRDMGTQLADTFGRIADALEARGDEELAEIIRDDAPVMSAGLVTLTRPFKFLRVFLTGILTIIQPLLAFGRVLRVLAVRWAEQRADRRAANAPSVQE